MNTNTYENFVKKFFPYSKIHSDMELLYKYVCTNNVLTEIYMKYLNPHANCLEPTKLIYLEKYTEGINKLLVYIPLNDNIGVNASMRYIIEQLLKFLYSIYTRDKVEKINITNYRHIKDYFKLNAGTINIDSALLNKIYNYYAKYSNDLHEKSLNAEDKLLCLQKLLTRDNNYIDKVIKDLKEIIVLCNKIIIRIFNIKLENLSVAERLRLKSVLSNKMYKEIITQFETV